jgi:hypothetical protein
MVLMVPKLSFPAMVDPSFTVTMADVQFAGPVLTVVVISPQIVYHRVASVGVFAAMVCFRRIN